MQGVANFALRRRNAGNSIHIGKFRLCKSAEKNCSEAGSYYSCLAYDVGRQPVVTHRGRPVEVMAFCSFVRLSSGLGLWCNVILRLDVPIGAERVHGIRASWRRSSHRAGGMGKDRSICAFW